MKVRFGFLVAAVLIMGAFAASKMGDVTPVSADCIYNYNGSLVYCTQPAVYCLPPAVAVQNVYNGSWTCFVPNTPVVPQITTNVTNNNVTITNSPPSTPVVIYRLLISPPKTGDAGLK